MKCVTPENMRMIDDAAISQLKIPGIILMENAAFAVLNEIENAIGDVNRKNIAIFAGKGNNGGDALAVARHLYARGADVIINLLAEKQELQGDARENLIIVEAMGIRLIEMGYHVALDQLMTSLFACDLVVDGIFGTGFKGAVRGIPHEIIDIINHTGKPVIAIDIPSGVDGATGHSSGMAIKADRTVTFVLPKVGLMINDGAQLSGKLSVSNIGIPEELIDDVCESYSKSNGVNYIVITACDAQAAFTKRRVDTNKSDYGRVLVAAGSRGMLGAAKLSSCAALRCGAGLLYLAACESNLISIASTLIEPVILPVRDKGEGFFNERCAEQLSVWVEKESSKKVDVLLVGPGMTVNNGTRVFLKQLLSKCTVPVVLDADALNIISEDTDAKILSDLKMRGIPVVITPHPGEMARLTRMSVEAVQADRIGVACQYAKQHNVTVVLKGYRTIIAASDGTVFINTTGNPGMATAGSGDVLAGIIAAIIAMKKDAYNLSFLVACGVFLHGYSGDLVAKNSGEYGIIASDIVDKLPQAINEINR